MKRGAVVTEGLFLTGLLSVSMATSAARDDAFAWWAVWLVAGGLALGFMRYRDAHPPEAEGLSLWDRFILWRPVIDAMLAYRFWTALASHENGDFRERVLWASGVMMARGAKAKDISFPCQVTLTERNLSNRSKAGK